MNTVVRIARLLSYGDEEEAEKLIRKCYGPVKDVMEEDEEQQQMEEDEVVFQVRNALIPPGHVAPYEFSVLKCDDEFCTMLTMDMYERGDLPYCVALNEIK